MSNSSGRYKTFVFFFFGIILTIFLASFAGYSLFRFLNRTPIEDYFVEQKPFAIQITGDTGAAKNAVQFISFAIVNPATSRIGLVSFYPETKLSPTDKTLANSILSDESDAILASISELLGVEIPYHIQIKPEHVSRVIDLIEGVPYFLWQPDLLSGESLPLGEFTLEGALVTRLISPPTNNNEYSPAFQLFRHYSLILNLWHHRKTKWEILKNPEILNLALGSVKTNLNAEEILFLGNTIWLEKNWMPLFLETPVKRIKDDFIIDTEATLFYLKSFKKILSDKTNPYVEMPPKMEVKNGTDVPNLARELRNKLSSKGVQVIEFANADHHDYENTILIDTGANPYYLETVARMISTEKAYHSVNKALFTDLVMILGRDYKKLNLEK